MAKNSDIDVRIKLAIESKEYKQAVREANKEAKEFKRQQREAFKQAGAGASDGFGSIVAAAKKVAPTLLAAVSAFDVMKRAVQDNNYLWDEWERSLESAQASYTSFLHSLTHGDFSNFFDNMAEVIANAREAASALQDLDDAKMFGRKAQAEIDYESEQFYSVLKNKNASRTDVDAAIAGLAELRNRQENVKLDEASANLYTLASKFAEVLSTQGVSANALDLVRAGADGRYEKIQGSLFDKYFKDLYTFRSMQARFEAFANTSVRTDYQGNKYRGVAGYGTISEDEFQQMRAIFEGVTGDLMEQLFGYYNDALAGLTSVQRARNQDMRTIQRWETGGGGGGKSAGVVYAEGSMGYIEQQIGEWTKKLKEEATVVGRQMAQAQIDKLEETRVMMATDTGSIMSHLPGVGLQGVDLSKMRTTTLNLQPNQYYKPTEDANKDLSKSSETAAEGIMLVASTLDQLGITSQIADDGLRTTMNVIGNFLSMVGGVVGGPWGKVLQGVGGIIGSFSDGGIVGGTSYTGDRLTARVNSGEMILNNGQQRRLFDMIDGNGGGSATATVVLRGEDTYISLRNYGRRTGKIYLP